MSFHDMSLPRERPDIQPSRVEEILDAIREELRQEHELERRLVELTSAPAAA